MVFSLFSWRRTLPCLGLCAVLLACGAAPPPPTTVATDGTVFRSFGRSIELGTLPVALGCGSDQAEWLYARLGSDTFRLPRPPSLVAIVGPEDALTARSGEFPANRSDVPAEAFCPEAPFEATAIAFYDPSLGRNVVAIGPGIVRMVTPSFDENSISTTDTFTFRATFLRVDPVSSTSFLAEARMVAAGGGALEWESLNLVPLSSGGAVLTTDAALDGLEEEHLYCPQLLRENIRTRTLCFTTVPISESNYATLALQLFEARTSFDLGRWIEAELRIVEAARIE